MALFGFDDILYVADIESGEILFETNAEGLYDMGFSGNDAVIYSIGYNITENSKEAKELTRLSNINEAAMINANSEDLINQLRNLFNTQL